MYQPIPDGGKVEVTNPYRELADAIRAGCKTTGKNRDGGYFGLGNKACALGAAMIALNLTRRSPGAVGWVAGPGEKLLLARFPILDEKIAGQKLSRRITRMNDHSEMSREKIADLIEALGDKEARTRTIHEWQRLARVRLAEKRRIESLAVV
jgi:hypothetical protein